MRTFLLSYVVVCRNIRSASDSITDKSFSHKTRKPPNSLSCISCISLLKFSKVSGKTVSSCLIRNPFRTDKSSRHETRKSRNWFWNCISYRERLHIKQLLKTRAMHRYAKRLCL